MRTTATHTKALSSCWLMDDAPSGASASTRRVARAGLWTIGGFCMGQVLRLASNLALTRLVTPEIVGLAMIVEFVRRLAALLGDVGIAPSIIQNKREDDAFINTAWTLQAVRGVILTLVTAALAVPFALLHHEPRLYWAIPVAGLTALLSGLWSTRLYVLNRGLHMRRIAMIEVLSKTVGFVVTLGWALYDPSLWAPLAGALALTLAKLVLSHAATFGPRLRFQWDSQAIKSLLRFGRWILLSTILGFMASNVDRVAFDHLEISRDELGVYAVATLILSAPTELLTYFALSLHLPLLSAVVRTGQPLAPAFARAQRTLQSLGGMMTAGLAAGAPAAVLLLWDSRYEQAGTMAAILAAGLWLGCLRMAYEMTLIASGRTYALALASTTKLAALVVAVPLGFRLGGFHGAIWGFALAETPRLVVAMLGTRGLALHGHAKGMAKGCAYAMAAGALAWGTSWGLNRAGIVGPGILGWLHVGLVFLAPTLVYAKDAHAVVQSLRANKNVS